MRLLWRGFAVAVVVVVVVGAAAVLTLMSRGDVAEASPAQLASIFDADDALVVLNVDQANDLAVGDDADQSPQRRNVVNEHVDEVFTCANMSLLRFDAAEPFRKGRRRTAWLARWFSGTQLRRYVVKRPLVHQRPDGSADADRWRADVRELAAELESMRRFDTWHVVVPFGGCFDESAGVGSPSVGLVTEFFDHYTLTDMLYLPAPWCVRARVALGFVIAARQLGDSERAGAGVLCDWSLSNFVIRLKDYRLVAVDVSSWHALQRRADGASVPLHAGARCRPDAANDTMCQELAPRCVLSLDADTRPPDAACDAKTRQCGGFDERSHAWLLGRFLLPVLARGISGAALNLTGVTDDFWLLNASGDLEFQSMLLEACRQLTAADRRKRLKLSSVENRLRSTMGRFNARDCLLQWQWHNRRH